MEGAVIDVSAVIRDNHRADVQVVQFALLPINAESV